MLLFTQNSHWFSIEVKSSSSVFLRPFPRNVPCEMNELFYLTESDMFMWLVLAKKSLRWSELGIFEQKVQEASWGSTEAVYSYSQKTISQLECDPG